MKEYHGLVYRARCIVDEKKYVGQTTKKDIEWKKKNAFEMFNRENKKENI